MCLAWCAFVVLGFGGTAQAQAPPYDADDAHARRLYEQYKQSQERVHTQNIIAPAATVL